jgi:putative hemolysin
MSDIVQQLLLQFILILLNAFFAATEIAVISINEKKVKALAEDGDKKAKKMLKMIEDPTKFLSTIQIGITLAGFLGSAFAADNFAERLAAFSIETFQISKEYINVVNTASVIIITLVLSFFTLVLGELVPKRVAMKHKEKLANAVCGIISALALVLKPIIWLLTASTNGVIRLFGIDPHATEEAVSEEDIVLMLDAGADEGTLDEDDIEYIKNVFKIDELCAADVMTPKNSVVFISADESDEEILRIIEEEGYSRIPVYLETTDKIIGILRAKDYLLKRNRTDFSLENVILDPVFVPETIHLDLLMKDMQSNRHHMAIVVNEYGLFSGLVTLEDILEEIIGEIWDEQDEEVESFKKIDDITYQVKTSVTIEEFFSFFSLASDEEILSTTVNGWVIEQSGNIPPVGFSFDYNNISVSVTKADDMQTFEICVKLHPIEEEVKLAEENSHS